ncbi:MAG: hypothetical protein IPG56_03215 [Caulobacteraceae bacterium]|nr:hypothetical protein [Caulobacteraceae bacterium]
MPGSGRYNKKPLPKWAALALGILFLALGGFFVFALLAGEREAGASAIALFIAGDRRGFDGFGLFVVASVLEAGAALSTERRSLAVRCLREESNMPGKLGDPNAINGPHQDRRMGVARPEPIRPKDPADDTPDHDGIEIDNAIERPQEGQPGQPGAKVS